MQNLTVENLGHSIDLGRAEGLVGTDPTSVSEKAVLQEMNNNGMALPQPQEHSDKTFSDLLRNSIDRVNEYQHQADAAVKELVSGRSKNIHETMLAVERADLSLKLMMQVRNKVLDAYKEIIKMQV